MKLQYTNYSVCEPKGSEKFKHYYVKIQGYPVSFKMYYVISLIGINVGAWFRYARTIKILQLDSAHRELQNKLNLIEIWSQEPNLALRAVKINYVTSWTWNKFVDHIIPQLQCLEMQIDIKYKMWIEYFGSLGRLVARIRLNIITKLEINNNF